MNVLSGQMFFWQAFWGYGILIRLNWDVVKFFDFHASQFVFSAIIVYRFSAIIVYRFFAIVMYGFLQTLCTSFLCLLCMKNCETLILNVNKQGGWK